MANYSILVACPERSDHPAFKTGVRLLSPYEQPSSPGWGLLLTGRYCLPLFWVAGFARADVVQLSMETVDLRGDASVYSYSCAISATGDFVARINDRRRALLGMFPEPLASPYSDLIDHWIAFVEARFPAFVLLDPYEIPMLVGDDFDTLLVQAIDAVSRVGREAGVVVDAGSQLGLIPDMRRRNGSSADAVRTGLFGFCLTGSVLWPPDATTAELEHFGL